jgi:hypothetical protein
MSQRLCLLHIQQSKNTKQTKKQCIFRPYDRFGSRNLTLMVISKMIELNTLKLVPPVMLKLVPPIKTRPP